MRKALDLTDKQYGLWTVLYRVENSKHGKTQWMCRCDCGIAKVVTSNSLVSGNSTSCGCNTTRDLAGRMFGDMTVIAADYSTGRRAWCCSCQCGALIVMSAHDLQRGDGTMCRDRLACLKLPFAQLIPSASHASVMQ
jgi:hypothetical protein